MLQRDRQIRTQIQQVADACLFGLALWIAYIIRSNELVMATLKLGQPGPFENFLWLFVVLLPGAPLILESQGFYNHTPLSRHREMLWPLLKGCVLITVGLVLTSYFFHLNIARGIIVWFGFIAFAVVWIKEEIFRIIFRSRLGRAQMTRRFILAGTEKEIVRMRQEIQKHHDAGILPVAELNLEQLGAADLVHLLHEYSANGIILSARRAYFEQVENVIKACELEGVEVWLVADFFATQLSRTSFDELFGRPLLIFRTTPETSWQSAVKQFMDFAGSLALLVVLSPLLLCIAIAVKMFSPGPVFFRQERSGLNGAPFTLYKFRTMVTNAEQFKHELEAMNEMSGPVFKVTNDPRVTRIGQFLRKYSLDELPQLFNVLRGDMSLVGPRPLPVDEVKRFNDLSHRRRLSVKPGLTCLWQVSGRNQITDFRDWVRLDLEYIDRWSLWLDVKILFQTIPAVFAGTGAK